MDDLAAHLQFLEEQLFEPAVRGARERLEELLSRDFREIGRSGRLYDRDAMIEALLDERPEGRARGEGFEMRRISGTVALLTYVSIYTTMDGQGRRTRRGSLWRLEDDGSWRMVFHQGTPFTNA